MSPAPGVLPPTDEEKLRESIATLVAAVTAAGESSSLSIATLRDPLRLASFAGFLVTVSLLALLALLAWVHFVASGKVPSPQASVLQFSSDDRTFARELLAKSPPVRDVVLRRWRGRAFPSGHECSQDTIDAGDRASFADALGAAAPLRHATVLVIASHDAVEIGKDLRKKVQTNEILARRRAECVVNILKEAAGKRADPVAFVPLQRGPLHQGGSPEQLERDREPEVIAFIVVERDVNTKEMPK